MLVVLTVLWGVNWPVMKAGVHDFAPITFRTLCRVGGIVLLAVVARAQGHSLRVRREHWRELVLLALTNVVIWYVLAIWDVKLPSSGRAARLGYTMPVWTALFGWWLYRGRLDARTGFGVLAAFAAAALLLGSELATLTGRPLGTLFMLGAAAPWGLGTQLMGRRRLPGAVVVLTFWMLLMALVVSGVIAWATEREMWVRWPDTIARWVIAYNVFLVFGVSQLLWFQLASILPPVAVALHHATGAVGRAHPGERGRAGAAGAEDAVARWNDPPGDEPACVHAAAGGAGAQTAAAAASSDGKKIRRNYFQNYSHSQDLVRGSGGEQGLAGLGSRRATAFGLGVEGQVLGRHAAQPAVTPGLEPFVSVVGHLNAIHALAGTTRRSPLQPTWPWRVAFRQSSHQNE